jgi:photoactive yellow protein
MSTATAHVAFDAPDALATLNELDDDALDACAFGVIGMDPDGTVVQYNAFEQRRAGMTRDRVVGRHFFSEVAPCTNNYLVATRYEEEPALDAVIPYVFTLRMRPTPVDLRLLRGPGAPRMYLLVRPRGA